MQIDQVIAEARRRVQAMDEIDRKAGLATPHQCGREEVIDTAEAALTGAASCLKRGDIKTAVSCAADALVMLEALDK